MKKTPAILTAALFASILFSGCAKEESLGKNELNKQYFDAWMEVNYPQAQKSGRGIYITDDKAGTGTELTSDNGTYIFVSYVETGLDGTVSDTNVESKAKQLGTFTQSKYYGPTVWMRGDDYLYAGLNDMLDGMKVGGTRTAVVPGWLNTYGSYTTESGFLKHKTGTNTIYTIKLEDVTEDIEQWEIDSLSRYVALNMEGVDSLKYGFYYQQLTAPDTTVTLPSDTTVYINYVGRLLNGHVFDTNIADSAKFYGIYSASNTYGPTQIDLDEDYTAITMGSDESKTVDGFSYCLSKMGAYEKGRCAFYSALGYSYSGSGSSIPPYASIVFDIEFVDAPDD